MNLVSDLRALLGETIVAADATTRATHRGEPTYGRQFSLIGLG